MTVENTGQVDLLGDPWTELPDPRGRKRHKRTAQIAEKVAVLSGSGLSVEMIAARVFLSEPTLRKYYFRELERGPSMAKAVLAEKMFEKAKAGNVSAARFMREEFDRGELNGPLARARRARPEGDAKPAKLGKKDAANLAAETAEHGTSWGELVH